MEDKCKTGRVTIPTDLDVVPETLEILKKWGADAIRDCDGTDFPQELKNADAKIYSTYYTTRKDNAWAKANPDEVQQCYIMAGFYTAPGNTVTIPLMKGISPELMKVNDHDDITRWWEVMDRSTGQPVPPEQWSYADGSVTVQAVPFHEYTVSFLAYLIWDPVHMYNATTNGWTNFEHQITFDVRQPKTHKYSMERLRKFIAEHPYVNVIRYTTFFHQFTLIFDELKREKFVDWYGYSASVSPYILNQFEQEVGYKFRPEYIIDQGYYNNQYRVPSKEYRDFQAFQRREVAKLAKEMVDITHECGCEAMMFLGDHWIGTEPFMPEFKTIGLDAVVGSVGNGSTLRLLSDIEGVKYTEGRFLPYFFPDTFHEGGDPVKEAKENWVTARRAILRKPIDRIGYGGYLKLALQFPEFVDYVESVCKEFRELYENIKGTTPYCVKRVAVLNCWGKMRAWGCHMVHHALYYKQNYSYSGVIEMLSGAPFDVKFISFEDIKNDPKLLETVDVIINVGDADTAHTGGIWWEDPEISSAIRRFVWNGGNLMTQSLTDFSSGQVWTSRSLTPDFKVAGDTRSTGGRCSTKRIAETDIHPARLEITVEFSLGTLDVRRIYRICADTPAIACDTYLKGSTAQLPDSRTVNAADRKNIESTADMQSQPVAATLDRFNPGGFHWHTRIVEFQDVTDWNNNLVFETDVIPYRKNSYRGNLLFARNAENGRGFFFLKEAPGSGVQLAYGGGDFTAEFGDFTVTGLGVTEKDLREGEWVKAYGCVLGVWSGGELEQLTALRSYQKNLRKLLPGRDEMVMMNTWGDRSQDTKVNERFCLAEVRKAAHLGITHFQIDDGWQVGKSPNSAVAKGSFKNIWDNPDYWKPDPEKYPRGLHPVVELGRELGVEICLWFNPSVQDGYADWEKDAQALVGLYDEYGIRTFKIDGLAIPDKRSESNLRRLFDRVLERTGGQVVFNLDATAGRRGGYHMFNEYGNIFLENRYTDWQNYYPYWTLRNLWMLSKYVPAEKLQIEFLNKWRNTEKYAGDPFAPANYSFEYLFATTMAGQPLAWMEASGLPEEALGIGALIERYKEVQHDFHRGVILPVGDEPSGRSWTGFQSVDGERGYLIFFREQNPDRKARIETWLPENSKVRLTPVLGSGKAAVQKTGRRGTLEVELPAPNDYTMYRYELIR